MNVNGKCRCKFLHRGRIWRNVVIDYILPPEKNGSMEFSHFRTIYSPSVGLHCGTIHLPGKIRFVAMETVKVAKVSLFGHFWSFLKVFELPYINGSI